MVQSQTELEKDAQTVFGDLVSKGWPVGMLVQTGSRDGLTETTSLGDIGRNSLFEIGSLTKLYTASLLSVMHLRGEVHLGDSIGKYLPRDVGSKVGGITLIQLATHSSGLPRLPPNLHGPSPDPYSTYREHDLLESLELIHWDVPIPTYSNLGYGLLGYILARVAGAPLQELLLDRVCRPLELNHTFAERPPSDVSPKMAIGHDAHGVQVPPWNNMTLAGAGCIWSSPNDLGAFVQTHAFPRGKLREALVLTQQVHLAVNPTVSFGLGWHIIQHKSGEIYLWHNGSTGGFGAFCGVHHESRTQLTIITNSKYNPSIDGAALRFLHQLSCG